MFKLKANGTTFPRELIAGLTTFFTMAYIIAVNPSILSQAGMEWGAVFLATIISAVVGTLVMGLFANVPYALAPGMGLNAFFVFTVCFALKFPWEQALSLVFICGIINIIITVTRIRKHIIKAIPKSLQFAISGGIGVFIAYVGLVDVGILNFGAGVPGMTILSAPALWLFLFGLVLGVILLLLKVRGAILISIVATTLVGWGVQSLAGIQMLNPTESIVSFDQAVASLPSTFGVIFTAKGLGSLFSNAAALPLVILTIFSFSLSDTFDTIGTFVGTGRRTGIFNDEDEKAMMESKGFKSKMDKALFADSIATSVGAIVGTSNTTTYIESAAGIEAGGRTGLTSVVVAACFIVSAFFASFVSAIPFAATSPALVIVGIMMLSAFRDIKWEDLSEAIPAFFAGIFMALCFNITYGIATAFIFYCIVKIFKKEAKEVHPILWIATILFIANFVLLAII